MIHYLLYCLQGPVGFKVAVPNMPDRAEWRLHGQMITITLPITDPVSSETLTGNLAAPVLGYSVLFKKLVLYINHNA